MSDVADVPGNLLTPTKPVQLKRTQTDAWNSPESFPWYSFSTQATLFVTITPLSPEKTKCYWVGYWRFVVLVWFFLLVVVGLVCVLFFFVFVGHQHHCWLASLNHIQAIKTRNINLYPHNRTVQSVQETKWSEELCMLSNWLSFQAFNSVTFLIAV